MELNIYVQKNDFLITNFLIPDVCVRSGRINLVLSFSIF